MRRRRRIRRRIKSEWYWYARGGRAAYRKLVDGYREEVEIAKANELLRQAGEQKPEIVRLRGTK